MTALPEASLIRLADMAGEVAEWRTERLGDQLPLAHAAKVAEEAGELLGCEIAAVDNYSRSGRDPGDEAADVLVALLAYCDRTGIDLAACWVVKMRELWAR